MDQFPASVGIGVVAFASTNIDDLVMLIGFFADPAYRPREIVAGQFAGIAALIVLSLLGALVARAAPTEIVGLLGLVPIAIGVKKLVFAEDGGPGGGRLARRVSKIATVAVVTIANGGDNLGLYIPLFSVQDGAGIALLVALFLAMTALWCAVGHALVGTRLLGIPAQRWGNAVLPCVLIALGVYILMKTGALALFG